MAKKETYASAIIGEVTDLTKAIKPAIEAGDLATYNDTRAQINAGIIMACFGAEIVETKEGYALKFSKKPATTEELAELASILKGLVEDEKLLNNDDEIPGATEAAVQQLAPAKVSKKNLTEYLLTGPQAIGRLAIGPADLFTLSSLSEKYRQKRKNRIILFSVLGIALIAAGITTTCIIVHEKHKRETADDACDVDIDENNDEDIDSTIDEPAHVDIDM